MRLSDFKDEKAIEVVAKLLPRIASIVSKKENAAAADKDPAAFASAILANNAKDVKDMFAILNDINPVEYHCTAASVLKDTFELLGDPDLMELFGLQRQTVTSSASAVTIGEVAEG